MRQKSDAPLQLGELVVVDRAVDPAMDKLLLQVIGLQYGSQISAQNLELISGMALEEQQKISFFEPALRNYHLAALKSLLMISGTSAALAKQLPPFFGNVRSLEKEDLAFLTKPKHPLFIGMLRSGSRVVDVPLYLPAPEVLSHHVLVAATTGRGKSNLTSVLLWEALHEGSCSFLVLDPHDEYYGRTKIGLKDFPAREKVVYYTSSNPPPGSRTLQFNLSLLQPHHFSGVLQFSDAQWQACYAYSKYYHDAWIESIILEKPLEGVMFDPSTISVVKRRLLATLDITWKDQRLLCQGIFSLSGGLTTVADICRDLGDRKTVIVDTSSLSGSVEVLVGSVITHELLRRYQVHKRTGQLAEKPVVSIVLEEAPRVLGKDVLEKGSNIFETIAREGRKFKIGLYAITQLPSLIPRQILANMNTKIILGLEMAPERQAIIDAAAQDLSDDHHTIAALDKGEALITSNFTLFPVPVKIPLFEDVVKEAIEQKEKKVEHVFPGVSS